MIPILSLYLVLASGVSAPAPHAAASDPQPPKIVQTIRTQSDGTTKVDSRSVDPKATTLQSVDPAGRRIEATWQPEKRVLIEIRERPAFDRVAPGSVAEALHQRQQLAQGLAEIDARLQPATPSKITRQYQTLFSGVAATVDSAVIDEIRELPNVVAVYDDVEVQANLTESVPLIGATAVATTYGVTGAGVKVAVIDTGIDYTHPDLGGCFGAACRVVGGYDYVNGDNDPRDDHGHGTHVAGIIAANGTLKGVAPGATLLAYKVLSADGYGYTSNIIAALEKAVLDGAKVANLSLGGQGDPDDPTSQAVDNATAAGMLSVIAAGNWGSSYRTINSPGVARTALTVGATDKSWQMAYFSSRGYVVDGDHFIMKPEVVAPGVDIRSTVPTTGALGDPTRYKLLSGTSMATPHVAGSAALLLQWNAAQTPAELKNRLVGSARSVDGDVFARGAGGIDLVAAFGTRVLASPTHVSFGLIDATSGIVVREQTLSVRNTAATADTLSLTGSTLPAGATLEIIPSSVTLQPGASVDVTLRLQVDTAIVPQPPEPLAWSTSIAITGAAQTVKVPAYFLQGSIVTLSFDEAPWLVYLVSESGEIRDFYQPGTSASALVKSGLWDVMTVYLPPVAIVVREQVSVQQSLALSIDRDEATREATVRAIDEAGQPLSESDFFRDVFIQVGDGFLLSIGSPYNYRLSELSSRFTVGLDGSGPDSSGFHFFISSWSGHGFPSDVILPSGAPFRRLAQAAKQPAASPPTTLVFMTGFMVRTSWGGFGFLSGAIRPGELSRTLHFQTAVSPNLSMMPVEKTTQTVLDPASYARALDGVYLHHEGGVDVEASHYAFFDLLDPASEPDAVLGAAVERWDLDTSPNSLPLEFWSSSTNIFAYGFATTNWVSHTLSTIELVSNAQPTFDLYRNGALVGTQPLSKLNQGIPSEEGAHEIRSTSAYDIGAVSGSSQAVISFDTSKIDPNPPALSRFRIEQYGIRTPAPYYPATTSPKVKFRITDNFGSATVKLEWRTSGTPTWTELALSNIGSDYDAVLLQNGSIDLRLTATDAAGNTFQEEWTPAMITTVAPPPTSPASVTATRAGAATISVSWPAGSSPVGISGYRVERLPGNMTFTTSGTGTTFVDTNGLVSGNAYLYRVSAVDTNATISTPTAYDLATLIELRDDPVVAGVTPIRGTHIVDLRRAIDAIRHAAGLGSAWTNYDPPTGIVRASVFTELRDRLNESRSTLQLPTVQFSNSVAPGAPVRANDLLKLRDGVK